MLVDSRNFQHLEKQIIEQIQQCDFVAFDFEFSGLFVQEEDQVTRFDGVEDVYQKNKHLCSNHHILQLGLSLYYWKEPNYTTEVYNLFFSPPEGIQSFQTSSYKFLAANGFDFNLCFGHGLEVGRVGINQQGRKKLRRKILSFQVENELKNLEEQTLKFLDDPKTQQIEFKCLNEEVADIFNLDYCASKFFGRDMFKLEKEGLRIILKKQKIAKQFKERQKKQYDDQSEPVFATSIIEALIKNQKPLIGHHACIDLCFLVQNFIGDLPSTFEEYSLLVHQYFPKLYDTKLIAIQLALKLPKIHTYVEGMYKDCFEKNDQLKRFNNVQINIQCNQQFHDAGYDAFVTGAFFICYFNYTQNQQMEDQKHMQQIEFKRLELSAFDQFANKLYSGSQNPFLFDAQQVTAIEQKAAVFNSNTIYYEQGIGSIMDDFISYLQLYGSFELHPVTATSGYILFNKYFNLDVEEIIRQHQKHEPKLFTYENRKRFKAE